MEIEDRDCQRADRREPRQIVRQLAYPRTGRYLACEPAMQLRPCHPACTISPSSCTLEGTVGRRIFAETKIQARSPPDGVLARHRSGAIVLVKDILIPCFGRKMTMGRASMVWPGVR